MKPIKAYTALFLVLIGCSFVHAQYGAQQRGDYYFSKFAYAKAIPEYELMINGNVNTVYAHQQLAECYLLLRDFKNPYPILRPSSMKKAYQRTIISNMPWHFTAMDNWKHLRNGLKNTKSITRTTLG